MTRRIDVRKSGDMMIMLGVRLPGGTTHPPLDHETTPLREDNSLH